MMKLKFRKLIKIGQSYTAKKYTKSQNFKSGNLILTLMIFPLYWAKITYVDPLYLRILNSTIKSQAENMYKTPIIC